MENTENTTPPQTAGAPGSAQAAAAEIWRYLEKYHWGNGSAVIEEKAIAQIIDKCMEQERMAKSFERTTLRVACKALIQDAETCLNNAHWEVRYGSGDLIETIQQARVLLGEQNNQILPRPGRD